MEIKTIKNYKDMANKFKEITDKFTDIDEDTLNYIIKLVLY